MGACDMTKDKALQAFFEGFGMPAYPESTPPEDETFPLLTYRFSFGAFGDGEVSITVNLYYRTFGEAEINAKAQEISDAIGMGGKVIPCDGGCIWLKRGTPFCQSMTDAADHNIKRRYINLTAEFITQN